MFLWLLLMAGVRAEILPAPRLSVPMVFAESQRFSVEVWTAPETNVYLEELVDGEWLPVISANYVYDPPICFSLELSASRTGHYRILRAWCEWSLDRRFNRELY